MYLPNRDISWLAFNKRVLLEAASPDVPLYERLKFMSIFSSNLDEFFRVRVSALRFFKKIEKANQKTFFGFKPKKILKEVLAAVGDQQRHLGRVFNAQIIPDLKMQGIHLICDYQELNLKQTKAAEKFFSQQVRQHLRVFPVCATDDLPFLENRGLYFVVQYAAPSDRFGIVNIPSDILPRFLTLPTSKGFNLDVIFLDEIVRMHLGELFASPVVAAYAIKISRDAELYIDDEYSGNIVEKVQESLAGRSSGLPTRLLYDAGMPEQLLHGIAELFGLKKADLVPGGKFHNFQDFISFPEPADTGGLYFPPLLPLPHPGLSGEGLLFDKIKKQDHLLHYPYQRFDYLLTFLREAADDPLVESLEISLYRIVPNGAVVEQLCRAARAGKKVMVFAEIKARFDEAANIAAAAMLKTAGATVKYSLPGIKVHAKALLVKRNEAGKSQSYAYLSTGNFNEKTAKQYADNAIFTCDKRITGDIQLLFGYLKDHSGPPPVFNTILVAPWTARNELSHLILEAIQAAQTDKKSAIFLKMNNLEDPKMIWLLLRAAQEGVQVRLIVRGICCLAVKNDTLNPPIQIVSIIDRFLEHSRVFVFEVNGRQKVFLSSADLMERNLDRRVEIIVPVNDPVCKKQLVEMLEIQWRDNIKSHHQHGAFQIGPDPPFRAQSEMYAYLKKICS